jgi:predicted 3-demethylubiquinone-9 3-methyltransferase (glyoxalase superfamily)
MQKLRPCLWFDHQAEQAATFYTSLFKNSKIIEVSRYSEAGPGTAGSVLGVAFELDGREFFALNGGPAFELNESFSIQIDCADQDEVDRYWTALLADGGAEGQCGWVRDRFGLWWQVVPEALPRLLGDPEKAERVTKAMFEMRKLDIAALEAAAR